MAIPHDESLADWDDEFPYGNTPCYLHIRDARDALMRGRPDVREALAAIDRAEEDGIAAWRRQRERSPSFREGIEIDKSDADNIADLDQARRELEAVPPKPHAALPLLDRIVAGMRGPVDTSPRLPLSAAGYLPRKTETANG